MAYVISTFEDRYQADSVVDDLKGMAVQDADYAVTDRGDTVKGWFQRLFGPGDDAPKLQSKGVPADDARYYENQLEQGCVLLVARTDVGADVPSEQRPIPVREEELRTGKREREAGEVTVSKDI